MEENNENHNPSYEEFPIYINEHAERLQFLRRVAAGQVGDQLQAVPTTPAEEVFQAFAKLAFREMEIMEIILGRTKGEHSRACWPHLRILFEALTTAVYISQDLAERVRLYQNYSVISADKLLIGFGKTSPDNEARFKALREQFEPIVSSVRADYQNRSRWAGKEMTFIAICEEVGNSETYEFLYRWASGEVHSNWFALRTEPDLDDFITASAMTFFAHLLALCSEVLTWENSAQIRLLAVEKVQVALLDPDPQAFLKVVREISEEAERDYGHLDED